MAAFARSIGMQHHRPGMAHGVRIRLRQHLDVVPRRQESVDESAVEARFHAQIAVRCAPGAAQQPARGVDRAHEWRPVAHVAREYRRLRLRLTVAAHGAVGDDAAVGEHGERRIERMRRQPAGLEHVQRAAFERKARAAILHQHAGPGQHHAGAEFPVERLEVGDDETGGVGGADPNCAAGASRGLPRRGLAAIDGQSLAVEERRREIAIDGLRQAIGIRDHPVARGKGPLCRFDEPVHVVESLTVWNAHAREQREDEQRREPLRRRRRIEDGVVIERHRERLGGDGGLRHGRPRGRRRRHH